MADILINVKESLRKIVAVCDSELLGKYFEEGNRQLDINRDFFGGEKKSKEQAIEMLRFFAKEDSIFNIAGKESVDAALKAGIISKKGVMSVQKVPFALSLL